MIRPSDFTIDTFSVELYNISMSPDSIKGKVACLDVVYAEVFVSFRLMCMRHGTVGEITSVRIPLNANIRRVDDAKIGYRSLQLPRFLIR